MTEKQINEYCEFLDKLVYTPEILEIQIRPFKTYFEKSKDWMQLNQLLDLYINEIEIATGHKLVDKSVLKNRYFEKIFDVHTPTQYAGYKIINHEVCVQLKFVK